MTINATLGAPLRLFNSWSRQIETFEPMDPEKVRLYSCGPTVYNYAHIGNLRAYVFTDLLRRTLNWKGWAINHVINITNVGHLTSDQDEGEDKMEVASKRLNRDIWQIAEHFTDAFKNDLAQLNVMDPTIWSTATDHIQDMIAFARILEQAGATYQLDSGLYFDTSKISNYGHLALIAQEGQSEVARIEKVEGKRNSTDFAIWRRSPNDVQRQMEWLSPWGVGAPGWHLECSVMSMKYLGTQFDIHTGGIDHRQIHHCNEIAQNQTYTGDTRTGANWWMHNNFLIDRTGKMSKSSGDFITLTSLIKQGIHPLAFRMLCLSSHYRSELEFSSQTLHASLTRLKRLVQAVAALRAQVPPSDWMRVLKEYRYSCGASFGYQREFAEAALPPAGQALLDKLDQALANDLMTPRALPLLDDALHHRALTAEQKLRVVASMDLVLGLKLLDTHRAHLGLRPENAPLTDKEVEALVAERQKARQDRDFATSDRIRNQLTAAGVEIMDGQVLSWEWNPTLS